MMMSVPWVGTIVLHHMNVVTQRVHLDVTDQGTPRPYQQLHQQRQQHIRQQQHADQ